MSDRLIAGPSCDADETKCTIASFLIVAAPCPSRSQLEPAARSGLASSHSINRAASQAKMHYFRALGNLQKCNPAAEFGKFDIRRRRIAARSAPPPASPAL